jgi:hypothetical protein
MSGIPPNTRTDDRIIYYVMHEQYQRAEILVAIAEQLEEAFFAAPVLTTE